MKDEQTEPAAVAGSPLITAAGWLLECQGLSKVYGSPRRAGRSHVRALSEVTLGVARGECLGVVGEAGRARRRWRTASQACTARHRAP